ncbi:MAG TPA: hypothetical protein VHL34_15930 [Rhizomicrobium sp.]|jgi:hypothetical protein|nr:hypothetical protein [Rhizomicrobium sp.]
MRTKTTAAPGLGPVAFLAALSLCALVPLKAHADGHGEIVTAMTHADLAGKAADIDGVHMHLHHALNCLVGPSGAGYDAKQMNPCANAGNGAIPDTADAAKKAALQEAAKSAAAGIAETDVAKAKADAAAAASKLMAL